EVSYWLGSQHAYVEDIKQNIINRDVYPHLPESLKCPNLPQYLNLTDQGFKRNGNRQIGTDLGPRSGRMPLIALNGIISKLILFGGIKMYENYRSEQKSDLQDLATQKIVA
ncbi:MAG: hypothetical protein ACPGEF_03325, partial [Endozoicomonas sp.]